MKKKIIVAVLIAIVFVGTFVFLWAKSQPQPEQYTELTASVKDLKKTTVITGRIEPRNEVNVKPQISGIITEIMKEAGQPIQAGEVIAKVKVIPDMGQLSGAQARVRLAKINLDQAKAEYEREKTLFDKGLVAAQEYEKVKQGYQQAKEERSAADDNLQVVRDGVSKSNAKASSTLIRSTITGIILDIPVKVGNSVILSNTFNDGTTIASVANMNDLIFKGNIDETEVAKLRKGMDLSITVGATPDVRLAARLEFIAPKVSSGTTGNQFEIKGALLQTKGTTLRAGYSANAEIILDSRSQVIALPESAVKIEDGKSVVYVQTGGKDSQTFERRVVQTGLSDGVNIEIRSGLRVGERVRGNEINQQQ